MWGEKFLDTTLPRGVVQLNVSGTLPVSVDSIDTFVDFNDTFVDFNDIPYGLSLA